MSNNRSKMMLKLDALRELTQKSIPVVDITDMLKTDHILSDKDIHDILNSYDSVEALFIKMELAYKNGSIDLLNYEWSILPKSTIRITIVSQSQMRELVYEG